MGYMGWFSVRAEKYSTVMLRHVRSCRVMTRDRPVPSSHRRSLLCHILSRLVTPSRVRCHISVSTCHDTICRVTSRHVVSCQVLSCQCHVMLRHVMSHHVTSSRCHLVSCEACSMLCHAMPCLPHVQPVPHEATKRCASHAKRPGDPQRPNRAAPPPGYTCYQRYNKYYVCVCE